MGLTFFVTRRLASKRLHLFYIEMTGEIIII